MPILLKKGLLHSSDRLVRNHRSCESTPSITVEFRVCTAPVAVHKVHVRIKLSGSAVDEFVRTHALGHPALIVRPDKSWVRLRVLPSGARDEEQLYLHGPLAADTACYCLQGKAQRSKDATCPQAIPHTAM